MDHVPRILLHSDAHSKLPATGQRRALVIGQLRKIQRSPGQPGDLQSPFAAGESNIHVNYCAGFAISWVVRDGKVFILDIHGQ